MNSHHTLFVCTTCASTWQDGKRVGRSQGERLLEEIQAAQVDWALKDVFRIEPVACMSACSQPCTVAFTAPGKHTFLFGHLKPSDPESDSIVSDLLECAELYYQKADGLMGWTERPEGMKRGLLARIPPFPPLS